MFEFFKNIPDSIIKQEAQLTVTDMTCVYWWSPGCTWNGFLFKTTVEIEVNRLKRVYIRDNSNNSRRSVKLPVTRIIDLVCQFRNVNKKNLV